MSDVADLLLAACRVLDGEGLTEAFGHVSARDGGSLLLTPRVGPGLVGSVEELLRVDGSGALLAGDPDLVPGEAALHYAVYRARPDVACVCRFHGPAGLAFSTLGRPLRP